MAGISVNTKHDKERESKKDLCNKLDVLKYFSS